MPDPKPQPPSDVLIQSLQSWATLEVTGPDRCSWLDGLLTCDTKTLKPGQATWGLILNRLGKIQAAVYVLETSTTLWLCLAPETVESVFAELDKMLIMEDAELQYPSEAQAWFVLHGSAAPVLGERLGEGTGADSAEMDILGLGGCLLRVPQANSSARLATEGLTCMSEEQWTALRLERGMPAFGIDFTGSDRPHEAGLERKAVNWKKGCYLGQEVVCMQDMRGKVKKSSRVLQITAPRDAPVGGATELLGHEGTAIGKITSCAYSEKAQSWLIMARLKMDKLDGALSIVAGNDQSYPAVVSELF